MNFVNPSLMCESRPAEQASDHSRNHRETYPKISIPLVFVPISNDEASQGRPRARHLVRAHLTRLQHATSLPSRPSQSLDSWYVARQTPTAQLKGTKNQWQVGEMPSTSQKRRKVCKSVQSNEEKKEEKEKESASQNTKVAAVNVPLIPAARRAGAGRQDPFWSYPVEHEPYLPAIFAHYIENVAVDIPDLDCASSKGSLRHCWFPLAMEAPSTMYAVLLMAASHFCALHPPHLANRIDLLYLKSRALDEINKALRDSDSQRATRDAVVGAVMKMAAYEAIFGDTDVFSAHMKGLAKMVETRGGLRTLGLDGLLERMVVWIDLNAAFLCGSRRLFGNDSFPTRVTFDKPDPYHFAGIK